MFDTPPKLLDVVDVLHDAEMLTRNGMKPGIALHRAEIRLYATPRIHDLAREFVRLSRLLHGTDCSPIDVLEHAADLAYGALLVVEPDELDYAEAANG